MDRPRKTRSWGSAVRAIVAIVALMGVGVVAAVVVVMKRNDAYKMSIAAVSSHDELRELLGAPLKPGFFVSGTIRSGEHAGEAELSYSIDGALHDGKVKVHATSTNGKWQIQSLVVAVPDVGKRIDVVSLAARGDIEAGRKWNNKAWKAFKGGDFATAEAHLAEALKADPNSAYAYHLRGTIKHNRGLKTKDIDLLVSAEEDYLTARELDPSSTSLQRDLGRLQEFLDRQGVE